MSLSLTTRINHATAPTMKSSEVIALATLIAEETKKEHERKPIDLIIVLDKSGSMSGEKLELCKKTLKFLVEECLNEMDFIALVTFDSHVYVEYEGGKMNADNKTTFLKIVETLRSGSCTNLSAGLLTGIDILKKKGTSDVAGICILTDGMINEGITDRERLVAIANAEIEKFDKGRARPPIFTFGYGKDADTKVMSLLAESTSGTYYAIKDTESVPLAFADCLGGLMSMAAQNIELTCEVSGGGADLAGDPLTKFPFNKISACVCRVTLKDMYCGEHRDILFRVRIPEMDTTAPTLVKFTCKYVDTINERPQSISGEIRVDRVKGDALPEGPGDVEVAKHVTRVEAAIAMEKVKEATENGDFQRGNQVLDEVILKAEMAQEMYGEDDVVMSGLLSDLRQAKVGVKSKSSYAAFGHAQLTSSSMQHWAQRSNKADYASSTSDAASNPYANQQKRKMLTKVLKAFDKNQE